MRHRKRGRKFGRSSEHRRLMFRNMANALIEHEVLRTTLPKAKQLRMFAEPLITLSRVDSLSNRRQVFARLRDSRSVGKLFAVLGPRFRERPGGYLRVLRGDFRRGDGAPIAYVILLNQEDGS